MNMKKIFGVLFLSLFASLPCLTQTTNTFYALQFKGSTVGAKVTAAQASCSANTAIPCIIVIDPSLAAWPTGSMPAACAQCFWEDYRNNSNMNVSIGPRYYVTQFGAVGNGTKDDTAAIQAAFDACYNGGVAPYGGIVEFPGHHTYIVSSTINAHDGCEVEGVTGSSTVAQGPPELAWNGALAGNVATITAFSIASNVATFTAANSLTAGQYVDIEGLTTGTYLNRAIVQVLSTGLSSTQFEATLPFGWSNVSTTSDSGTATTVNVLLAFDSSARYQSAITNMDLTATASAMTAHSLQVDAYFGSRVDTGTRIAETWAQEATMYGYYFAVGGINVDFDKGWRCDGVGLSCIYWRVSGADSFGIANGTTDNYSGALTTVSGASVVFDYTNCGATYGVHFTSRNMKMEVNSTIQPGWGVFTMLGCPASTAGVTFNLDLENTWMSPGGNSTAGVNFTSFAMVPSNDAALSLSIVNGQFPSGNSPNTTTRWMGLPTLLRNDIYGTSGYIPLLSFGPPSNSAGIYSGYRAPISLIGDVNIGQLWQDGAHASDFLYSDTAFAALPNGTTLYAGQILAPPAYWNGANGLRYAVDVVYQTGTTGTLNSGNTTCSSTNGSNILTCSSATDLSVGQQISLSGYGYAKEITFVDATNPSSVLVHLYNNMGATLSNSALSFSQPVLGTEIQFPTKSSAVPTTLTWSQGDMEQNSGAAANGIAAWVNVAGGTPGTWAGIPLGDSSGKLTNSQLKTPPLPGTTGSIGGSALAAGACATGTASVTGATSSMGVAVAPAVYPGAGMIWEGYVSSSGTVTVYVCAEIAGTPTATTYNVRVLQ